MLFLAALGTALAFVVGVAAYLADPSLFRRLRRAGGGR